MKFLVDPVHITDYNRTDAELELLLLFCIAVAGKNATRTAKNLERLLSPYPHLTPFRVIQTLARRRDLAETMRKLGFGCYNVKSKGFIQAANSGLNLRTCSVSDLEKIHGIGMKTARFFILHTRKNAQVACLDVHVLRYLKDMGHDVPSSTPQSRDKYKNVERLFLRYASVSGKTSACLDLLVWNAYSGRLSPKKKERALSFLRSIQIDESS